MTAAMYLRVGDLVAACEKRTTTAGVPLLDVRMRDQASGQEVRAHHAYPDSSAANHFTASNLARCIVGQVVDLDASNPRFSAARLDCDAEHIGLPYQLPCPRKDPA